MIGSAHFFSDKTMSETNEWEGVDFMTSTQKSQEIEISGSPTCAKKRQKFELDVSYLAVNSTLGEGQDGSQTLSGCIDVSSVQLQAVCLLGCP